MMPQHRRAALPRPARLGDKISRDGVMGYRLGKVAPYSVFMRGN
jgi:hypothetical protein